MFRQRWMTVGLLIAIVFIGIKTIQLSVLRRTPPPPSVWFTCAVAVNQQAGELCVRGSAGASVSIKVMYCDGSQITSPQIRSQTEGEYRWVWHVQTACRGQARAKATALWPDNRQSEAIALFNVG
jgi:hypothetical protein